MNGLGRSFALGACLLLVLGAGVAIYKLANRNSAREIDGSVEGGRPGSSEVPPIEFSQGTPETPTSPGTADEKVVAGDPETVVGTPREELAAIGPRLSGAYRIKSYNSFPLEVQDLVDQFLSSEQQRERVDVVYFSSNRIVFSDLTPKNGEPISDESLRIAEHRAEVSDQIVSMEEDYVLVLEIEGEFEKFPDMSSAKVHRLEQKRLGRRVLLRRIGSEVAAFDMEDLKANPDYQRLVDQRTNASVELGKAQLDVMERLVLYPD